MVLEAEDLQEVIKAVGQDLMAEGVLTVQIRMVEEVLTGQSQDFMEDQGHLILSHTEDVGVLIGHGHPGMEVHLAGQGHPEDLDFPEGVIDKESQTF